MDEPYYRAPGQASNTMSPQTPGSNYAVNVNRTKTRKWVEAKVQNYDGDDWGAEEYDDEDADEQQPPPPVPSAQQHVSEPASASASDAAVTAGHRTLHVETKQPDQPPLGLTPDFVERPFSSELSPPSDSNPASASERGFSDLVSPASVASGGRPTSFARGAESLSVVQEDPGLSGETASVPQHVPDSVEPQDHIRTDQHEEEENEDALADLPTGADRRFSRSPQLPDVARMSVFGADLFSTTGLKEDPPPAVPRLPENLDTTKPRITSAYLGQLASPEFPKDVKSPHTPSGIENKVEDESDASASAGVDSSAPKTNNPEVSPISERGDKSLEKVVESQNKPQDLQPEPEFTVAPLRTPSPRGVPSQPPKVDTAAPMRTGSAAAEPNSSTANSAGTSDYGRVEESPSDYSSFKSGSTITNAYSPANQNDILRDQIIKSLSPTAEPGSGPAPFGDSTSPQSPEKQTLTRESTYSLGDYDSYWDDSAKEASTAPTVDKPEPSTASQENETKPQTVPEAQPPAFEPTVPTSTTVEAAPEDDKPSPIPEEPEVPSPNDHPELRRKFSWEVDNEEGKAATQQKASVAPVPPVPAPVGISIVPPQPEPQPQLSVLSPITDVSETEVSESQSSRPGANAGLAASDARSLAEVSQPDTIRPGQEQTSVREPSPVSVASHLRQSTEEGVPTASAAADGLSRGASVPAPESVPALKAQTASMPPAAAVNRQSKQSQVTPFRDIMSMGTPTERIAKYDETRDVFASMDSGLDDWLATIRLQHPEHANATAIFQQTLASAPAQGSAAPPPGGAVPPAQQPYYQQYLNASSPSTGTQSASRTRFGGLQMPSQSSSGFGNSSSQIGSKSKEVMQSAGKMGKNLFSKGKSKLRGSGDKVFH